MLNRSYNKNKKITIDGLCKITDAKLYSSDDVGPYSEFKISDLEYTKEGTKYVFNLPPHSVALLK